MKQSGAVAVGIVGLGALLYLRSRRTTAAVSDTPLIVDDALTVNVTGNGGRLPAWRGFASTPWDKTTDGSSPPDPGGGADAPGDAGSSIFAGAGASFGTEASDTGASFALGSSRGGGGGGGGGGSGRTAGTNIGTAASGSNPYVAGGGYHPPPIISNPQK